MAATFLCVAVASSEPSPTGHDEPSNASATSDFELDTVFQGDTERRGLMFRDGLQRRPHLFLGTPPIRITLPSQEDATLAPANLSVARPTGIRLVRPTQADLSLAPNVVVATPTGIRLVRPSEVQAVPPNITIANPTDVAVLRETDP